MKSTKRVLDLDYKDRMELICAVLERHVSDGLSGSELWDAMDKALCSRVCDLQDTIDISKWSEEALDENDSLGNFIRR